MNLHSLNKHIIENPNLYIGLLSGTSMDAIDCALVDFTAEKPKLLATHSFLIPNDFRNRCLSITNSGHCHIDEFGSLDVEAGELFAKAVLAMLNENNISANGIRAIGSHGQTLRHRPDLSPPFTLQIGDPHIIAERTKITVVADLRKRDMAAGGQGAPLAPGFHQSIFRHPNEDRVILNIGGISNITIIPHDQTKSLFGFDTGPGNGLLDAWISSIKNFAYDRNGEFAASGKIIEPLLEDLLNDAYFAATHPKSTGREYFNLAWLEKYAKKYRENNSNILPEDIQATLLELTTRSITKDILLHAPNASVYVCGGGVKNPILMQSLSKNLQTMIQGTKIIQSTESLGVPPEWVEAMLFAWIAKQTMEGKTSNCPSVTGARHAVPLGGIFVAAHNKNSFI